MNIAAAISVRVRLIPDLRAGLFVRLFVPIAAVFCLCRVCCTVLTSLQCMIFARGGKHAQQKAAPAGAALIIFLSR